MRVYIRRDRGRALRNGHVQYARMPVRLHSSFGPPVRHASWRTRLVDVAVALTFAVGGALSIALLLAFAASLFFVVLAIARVLHRYLGVGGS